MNNLCLVTFKVRWPRHELQVYDTWYRVPTSTATHRKNACATQVEAFSLGMRLDVQIEKSVKWHQ